MSAGSVASVRRRAGVLLVAVIAMLASLVLLGSGTASARPAAAVAASSSAPYPPVLCPTIAISTTHPFPGETITITGQGFAAGQALTLVMHTTTYVLGHVTTSAAGTFTAQVTLPAGVTGNHVIIAEGSGTDCPVDPIQILVGTPTSPGSGSPLPFTGVDILTALAIALGLIGVGLLVARGGRRSYRGAHTRH